MTITKDSLLSQILAQQTVSSGIFDVLDKKKSKQDRYFDLMRGINMTSYSTLGIKHTCPKKLQLTKLELSQQNSITNGERQKQEENIDFAFGKAVESGVHAVLLNKPAHLIYWDMFLAWDIHLLALHPKEKAKTFIDAWIAVEKFSWIRDNMLQGWEVAYFNEKPAIELSLCIDMENGDYYVGHVDVVMFNPLERRYRVLEIKTTGLKWIHEAMYKNSDQANGYTIVLDSIAEDLEQTATFEVFYLAFCTELDEWKRFDFSYSRSNRATWINTVLLDLNEISTYRKLNFFPKRGSNCMFYGKPCKYYGICDLDSSAFNGTGIFDIITEEDIKNHEFDFKFTLSQIIETQQGLI